VKWYVPAFDECSSCYIESVCDGVFALKQSNLPTFTQSLIIVSFYTVRLVAARSLIQRAGLRCNCRPRRSISKSRVYTS
jgi:hypothetical protein